MNLLSSIVLLRAHSLKGYIVFKKKKRRQGRKERTKLVVPQWTECNRYWVDIDKCPRNTPTFHSKICLVSDHLMQSSTNFETRKISGVTSGRWCYNKNSIEHASRHRGDMATRSQWLLLTWLGFCAAWMDERSGERNFRKIRSLTERKRNFPARATLHKRNF